MNLILRRFAFSTSTFRLTKLSGVNNGIILAELNNPKKRNALSRQFMADMKQAITQIQEDESAQCVILQSAERNMFCAGADLKERQGKSNFEVEQIVMELRDTFHLWYKLPIPTIVIIEGFALGGGLELSMACDIRLAVKNSILGLPETSLAIIPGAGGTQRLPRIIGIAKARELIYTGERFSPEEAVKMGLLNYSLDDFESAQKKAFQIALNITNKGPIAIRSAKAAINAGSQVDLDTGLQIEKGFYRHVIYSEDRLEGLKAFSEKRKPQYKGK